MRCAICEPIKKGARNRREIEHNDFEPHFSKRGKTIHLSGADQIRLWMVNVCGWKRTIRDSEKKKHREDVRRLKLLRKFERDNKIKFHVLDVGKVRFEHREKELSSLSGKDGEKS